MIELKVNHLNFLFIYSSPIYLNNSLILSNNTIPVRSSNKNLKTYKPYEKVWWKLGVYYGDWECIFVLYVMFCDVSYYIKKGPQVTEFTCEPLHL